MSAVSFAHIRIPTLARRRQPDFIGEGAWHLAFNLRIFELTRQNQSGVNRSAKYVSAIVVVHLLVNIVHGLAHRELRVGLDPPASIFVTVVVLVCPLLAMALVWSAKRRLGLILLSLSMFGSLLFGLYRHFLVANPDHVRLEPPRRMGNCLCTHGVWIGHHRGDWSLLGRAFPLDCERDFEQTQLALFGEHNGQRLQTP
jgi:hypothetical protein